MPGEAKEWPRLFAEDMSVMRRDANGEKWPVANCGSFEIAEHIALTWNAHPALVAVAKRAIGQCACASTMRPDIPCLSCAARSALATTGAKP